MDIDYSHQHWAQTLPPGVRQMFVGAHTLCEPDRLENMLDQWAVRLTLEYQGSDPLLLTDVPGGLVLGAMLLRRLVFPCGHEALSLSDLDAETLGKDWRLAERDIVLCCGRVRLTDLQKWRSQFESLGGDCNRLRVLTLVADAATQAGAAQMPLSLWVVVQTEAQRVIGSGLTVSGYGANLPGIYDVGLQDAA